MTRHLIIYFGRAIITQFQKKKGGEEEDGWDLKNDLLREGGHQIDLYQSTD